MQCKITKAYIGFKNNFPSRHDWLVAIFFFYSSITTYLFFTGRQGRAEKKFKIIMRENIHFESILSIKLNFFFQRWGGREKAAFMPF